VSTCQHRKAVGVRTSQHNKQENFVSGVQTMIMRQCMCGVPTLHTLNPFGKTQPGSLKNRSKNRHSHLPLHLNAKVRVGQPRTCHSPHQLRNHMFMIDLCFVFTNPASSAGYVFLLQSPIPMSMHDSIPRYCQVLRSSQPHRL
jgi:hypothetical protein